jgi:hypothetical protein
MVRHGIHRHGKGQNMAGHQEDEEQHLSAKEDFSPKATHEHLAGIGHTHDMRVPPLELPNYIAGIRGNEAHGQ